MPVYYHLDLDPCINRVKKETKRRSEDICMVRVKIQRTKEDKNPQGRKVVMTKKQVTNHAAEH